MPTRASDPRAAAAANGARPGVGDAAKHVADHARSLVALEVELAALELKKKAANLGAGLALAAAGAVLALYGLGFLFATGAAALDTFLPRWLSLLAVTLLLFGLAGLLVALGVARIRKGTPPTPEQAIDEAKRTTAALKS